MHMGLIVRITTVVPQTRGGVTLWHFPSLSFTLSLSLPLMLAFLSLFALDCSPFFCTLTPTHTFRTIREHPNNSSQVQFAL